MTYTQEEHKQTHNSANSPIVDCEYCSREVYRRTHRCFGDGASSVPVPAKKEND